MLTSRKPYNENENVKLGTYNFHSCTVHLDTIKFFYLPADSQ